MQTYNYGAIGNGAFIGLIDTDADVKWLCWPRFDSSYVFGSLIDEEAGGHFSIQPVGEFNSYQYYSKNTNILITEFRSGAGGFRVIDFAPRFRRYDRFYKPLMLVRKLELVSGAPLVRVVCNPKGDYGKVSPAPQIASNHIEYLGLENSLRLTTDLSLNYVANSAPFVLNQNRYIVMTWGLPLEAPLYETCEAFLHNTKKYWRDWVLKSSVGYFHQEQVIRSALALKLHQYDDTGAIIASCTTSLPEKLGSTRNWDYRYCWIRDAYYTLSALNHTSHFRELEMYAQYLQNIAIHNPDRYQPVYTITGEADMNEIELELDGYKHSKPVRVGNQAHTHIQNDVYGQILLSLMPLYTDARFIDVKVDEARFMVRQLLAKIEQTMDEPDAGIWEFRNSQQKHCYTFLFHWAGSVAGQKIAARIGDMTLYSYAQNLTRKAEAQIERCYDHKRQVYTQAVGSPHLDASILALVNLHYLDSKPDRARQHLQVLEQDLSFGNSLFYRYRHEDDFGKPQVAFLLCAFWYVEALARTGQVDKAIKYFEELLKYQNHLGLMSEGYDTQNECQSGNFPQTYSHVGLMNAAFSINNHLNNPLL
ncbi:MAG: glycoside hydrolase family 15 protein [Pseudomonadota bacterium]|nr:glycoside hydrolase family 15 protein [Pseudomonadota bacterium]